MSALRRRPRLRNVVIVISLAAAVLSGCSSRVDAAGPGSLAAGVDLSEVSYTVGSKEFTEQLVLCQITVAALESAGASVDDEHCGTVSTEANRADLEQGRIDMYWEYTGTAFITIQRRQNPSSDSRQLYQDVKRDDAGRGIVWLDPTPMNDTYAFAVDSTYAQRLNVQTLTDMSRVVGSASPDGTVCIEPEFMRRADGWGPLQERYGFRAEPSEVTTLDVADQSYLATDRGNPCVFGEVYATDARVRQLDLRVLRDDRNALPKYNAALTVRQEAFDRNPDIARVISPIAAALTDEVMTDLNAQVAVGRETPRAVARAWMKSQGFIT